MTFQGIFKDTFCIQGILSFLLFPDTFGKGWKARKLEGWKGGILEGWKVQGVLSFPLFPDTSTELSAAGAKRGVCNCIRTTIPSKPAGQGLVMIMMVVVVMMMMMKWWSDDDFGFGRPRMPDPGAEIGNLIICCMMMMMMMMMEIMMMMMIMMMAMMMMMMMTTIRMMIMVMMVMMNLKYGITADKYLKK